MMIRFGGKHERQLRLIVARQVTYLSRRAYVSDVKLKSKGRIWSRSTWIAAVFLGLGASTYVYFEYGPKKDSSKPNFRKYTLFDKEDYSSTSKIFRFQPTESVDWSREWQRGLWSVEIKQPQLQIAREYTPLPEESNGPSVLLLEHGKNAGKQSNKKALEFWIRREQSGEVSNYLHKLEIDDTIEVRGPKSRTEIPSAQSIVFVAGGTGIAPALQLATALLARTEEPKNLPDFHILWANRRREDCEGGMNDSRAMSSSWLPRLFSRSSLRQGSEEVSAIVRRLNKLKDAFDGKLKIDYFVDEEGSRITEQDLLSLIHPVSNKKSDNASPVVMVCGPDGFVAHFAGPKQWQNGGQIQGKVSGVLEDAERRGWEVVKL